MKKGKEKRESAYEMFRKKQLMSAKSTKNNSDICDTCTKNEQIENELLKRY